MLTINIWDLLWTFFNFFLLYFVLKKLLYKPIMDFMDARQARIDRGLERERQALESMQAGEERLAGEKEQCRAQARNILAQAQAACGEKQEELARETHREAQALRQKLQEEAGQARQEDEERLKAREQELAGLLVSRLLRRQ